MAAVTVDPGSVTTHALLTAALVSLWAPKSAHRLLHDRISLWLLLLIAAIASACWFGLIQPAALVFIALFATGCYGFYAKSSGAAIRFVAGVLVFVLSLALMAHVLPGLGTFPIATDYQVSSGALPYNLYANLDKVFVGFFLLAFGHTLLGSRRECSEMFIRMAPPALATLAVVMPLALSLDYVSLDLKWTNFFFVWAWKNLLYTCAAEEAFFRGFLQRHIARALAPYRGGVWFSIVIASLLFGLAHYAGGIVYVLLATVAGLGYGWVYQRTGRIEASILTHFLLNSAHFLFFTYPALS